MSQTNFEPEWLTVAETARLSSVSAVTVHRLIRKNLVLTTRLGKRRLINLASWRQLMAKGTAAVRGHSSHAA